MNEIEKQDRARRRLLLATLVAFGLWQGADLLARVFEYAGYAPSLRRYALAVAAPAGLIWGYFLVQSVRLQRRARRNPALAAALDDEVTRHSRLRAHVVGFWVVLGMQAVLLRSPVPAGLAAQVTIFVGVIAFLGAFLHAERSAG